MYPQDMSVSLTTTRTPGDEPGVSVYGDVMTDLTDKMRTCAAYLRQTSEGAGCAVIEAASLLIEAADALEKFVVEPAQKAVEAQLEQLGEPMSGKLTYTGPPLTFTDPGPPNAPPTRISRTCPKCGSRAAKKVHVNANRLECPACSYQWPFVFDGKWM